MNHVASRVSRSSVGDGSWTQRIYTLVAYHTRNRSLMPRLVHMRRVGYDTSKAVVTRKIKVLLHKCYIIPVK